MTQSLHIATATDTPGLPPRVGVGSVVAGKFRIERVLAEGGMGVIFAATHLQLDQPVAMKFLRREVGATADTLARFDREAKAAAQLKSEHVARVLDVGVAEDGTPYIVMEYLEGLNLNEVLEIMGSMEVSSVAEYGIQTCEGLAEAHARGIVHRDIKPDNLFLVERSGGWRTIKILDFGISKFGLPSAQNIATGIIMGSPCYMSPEQLRSTATVDHRTDIWSLGATLYELLTGKAAFDPALSLPELVEAILHQPSTPVRDLRPEVPASLAAVVDRCLAKDREGRFRSAAELAKALLPFAPARASGLAERAASMTPAFPDAIDQHPSERPTVISVSTTLPREPTDVPGDERRAKRRRAAFAFGSAGALLTLTLVVSLRGSRPTEARRQAEAPGLAVPTGLAKLPDPVRPSETVEITPPVEAPITPEKPSAPTTRATTTAATDLSTRTASAGRTVAPVSSGRPSKRPAAAPAASETPSAAGQVGPSGGRAPLRPIDTKNPFESP